MEHDACGAFAVLLEKPFQNMNDELHRRVVVVEDQDPVKTGFLGLGFGSRNDGGTPAGTIAAAFPVLHAHNARYGRKSVHVFLPHGSSR
jgi:hypothetical protein